MIDILLDVGLYHYLTLSLILILFGLLGILVSRNMIKVLMSIFILLIGVIIDFVAFGFYCGNSYEYVNIVVFFVFFVIALQIILALIFLGKIFKTDEYLDIEKTEDK